MAVISDKASDTNEPTVVSLSDYYPYGMTEPGRSWNAGAEGYRYGFNTQENVPELGEGHTTALYWEYDGRLGRRWNLDLITKEYESNYSVFGNSPIYAIDVNGADSTLFDDYGLELCRISNDNGATNIWFKVRTTDLTEQMYGHIHYDSLPLKGWTNPISKEEQESAVRSAKDYRDEKLLFGIYIPLTLKRLEQNIMWNAFVEIPNQIYANVSFEHLNDMSTSVEGRGRDHSHPAGQWAQPPSSPDIANAINTKGESLICHVWALGNQTLYIYDNTGVLAYIPFRFYLKNK